MKELNKYLLSFLATTTFLSGQVCWANENFKGQAKSTMEEANQSLSSQGSQVLSMEDIVQSYQQAADIGRKYGFNAATIWEAASGLSEGIINASVKKIMENVKAYDEVKRLANTTQFQQQRQAFDSYLSESFAKSKLSSSPAAKALREGIARLDTLSKRRVVAAARKRSLANLQKELSTETMLTEFNKFLRKEGYSNDEIGQIFDKNHPKTDQLIDRFIKKFIDEFVEKDIEDASKKSSVGKNE